MFISPRNRPLLKIQHSSGVAKQHLLLPSAVFIHTRPTGGYYDARADLPVKKRHSCRLHKEEYSRLLPHLKPVELQHGQVLYEIGQQVQYVYFPHHALISLVTQMLDGKIVEVGLVGRDGMSGLTALLGDKASPDRAIVQIPNGGTRVELRVIEDEFNREGNSRSCSSHMRVD